MQHRLNFIKHGWKNYWFSYWLLTWIISCTISCILIGSKAWSCEFKGRRPVLSLSGPATHLFYQLGLLKDPQLKMISTYHGLGRKDFDGEIVGGGLFLSPKFIGQYQDPIVFYDQNREQKRVLERMNLKNLVEISTQGDPFLVVERLLEKISPHLKGCEGILKELDKEITSIKAEIERSKPITGVVLFFLGKIEKGKRMPSLLMVRDGFVLFLLEQRKIESYPSPLNYVPWADKIIRSLEQKASQNVGSGGSKWPLMKIGLVGERIKPEQKIYESVWVEEKEGSNSIINIHHPTFLIPGLPQVHFMREFVQRIANGGHQKK